MNYGNARQNRTYGFGTPQGVPVQSTSQGVPAQQQVIDPLVLARAQELAQEIVQKGTTVPSSHGSPLKSWKAGSLQVSVWENESIGQDGSVQQYCTVSFERRYKDKTGQWKSTSTLRVNDLPRAQLLLSEAFSFLVLQEKNNGEGE